MLPLYSRYVIIERHENDIFEQALFIFIAVFY